MENKNVLKRVLVYIFIILINLGLIYISYFIYYRFTDNIIRTTDTPNGLILWIFIPILLIGIFLFLAQLKFRKFGLGITAMTISSILFLFFFLNRSLSTNGNYESFKLRNIIMSDQGHYLNIEFNRWFNSTEVTLDKRIMVDSVQVKILDGFFGIPTMSDEVRIVEKSNCNEERYSDLSQNELRIAYDLTYYRCFEKAIKHYNSCIELNPSQAECYFSRGEVYLVKKEYRNALRDFLISAAIKYDRMEEDEIEYINSESMISLVQSIVSFSETNKTFDDIGELMNEITTIDDFDAHQSRIEFCVTKLKKESHD